VLEGFTNNIKQSNWSLLTYELWQKSRGKELLCRMVPYNNQSLGINRPKSLDLPIYDQYFILSPPSNFDLNTIINFVNITDDWRNISNFLIEQINENRNIIPYYVSHDAATNNIIAVEPTTASYTCTGLERYLSGF
jgi:hypothetical protein